MALTADFKDPSPTGETPTVDTAVLAAIRARIQPREGFWQFEWPKLRWPFKPVNLAHPYVALFVLVYVGIVVAGVAWSLLFGYAR